MSAPATPSPSAHKPTTTPAMSTAGSAPDVVTAGGGAAPGTAGGGLVRSNSAATVFTDYNHPNPGPVPSIEAIDTSKAEKLRKDPKYRKYVQVMDRTLLSFDAVNEWADVIGFLTRLVKTLQAHPQFSVIPRKLVISKRLAQCLNPALPAGVHQKTLEAYGVIFENIGPAQLAEDLPLYSYGLFPFFQNAAMSVKPILLSLYEKYYLPLGVKLKPCLKGLILALLPGLEEEGNEFFERVLNMLDALSKSVGQGYFFHCLWLNLISVSHHRGAALNYLLRRMPKLSSLEDVAVVLGDDTSLLARALVATLGDKQLLVQRGALELLLVHFPLRQQLFRVEDLEMLIRAGICVVLRKDMSLNRRLYSWLLDSTPSPDAPNTSSLRLSDTNKRIVVSALRSMFFAPSDDLADLTKPYKVIISLLDKAEIGHVVLNEVMVDILWSLKEKCASSPFGTELLQTANMLFNMMEPFMIWRHLCRLVLRSDGDPNFNTVQVYELIDFTLSRLRWMEDESRRVHLPFFYYLLLCQMQ
ncbi:hypothetical protein HK102_008342, partial [Quaeritorhiza haematococci]